MADSARLASLLPEPGDLIRRAHDFADANGEALILAALVSVTVVLCVALRRAVKRGRVDQWVDRVAAITVMALLAEGMWEVATQRLKLPVPFALGVFFVFEAAMISSALRASRHMRMHGHPGKHGIAVWAIAATGGTVVALNAGSLVEFVLRLALPLLAASLWWVGLTADGTRVLNGTTWRWTPRRLLLFVGAIEPGERDAVQINRERLITAMVAGRLRLHHAKQLAWFHRRRLERMARDADDEILAEVRRRVGRAIQVETLTEPALIQAETTRPKRIEARIETAAETAPPVVESKPRQTPRRALSPVPSQAEATDEQIADAIRDHVRVSRRDGVEPGQREMVRLVLDATGFSVGQKRCVRIAKGITAEDDSPKEDASGAATDTHELIGAAS